MDFPIKIKENQNYPSATLLIYWSEELLKFLNPGKILMFARPSILPWLMISRLEEDPSFTEIVRQSSALCVGKLLLVNFLAKWRILWEPNSQVPIPFAAPSPLCYFGF